jgi:hypothetical protein
VAHGQRGRWWPGEPSPASLHLSSGLSGRVLATWLPSCGGPGIADRQADGTVAEVGHEVQPSAEGLDVAGDDLEGGDLPVLDLGHPGDAHAHGGGDLLLAQARQLAGLGELVPAGPGKQWDHRSANTSPPTTGTFHGHGNWRAV